MDLKSQLTIYALVVVTLFVTTGAWAQPRRVLECSNSDGSLTMVHSTALGISQKWYLEGKALPNASGIFGSSKQILSSDKSFSRSEITYKVRVVVKSLNGQPLFIDIHNAKTSKVFNSADIMTCKETNTLG